MRRHSPEATRRHIDACTVIATCSAAGNPMLVVESDDREFEPLTANIATRDGESVEICVRYEDGRRHKESWVDGRGEIVDGHHNRPKLWGAGSGELP
jgi:hypothetical protein